MQMTFQNFANGTLLFVQYIKLNLIEWNKVVINSQFKIKSIVYYPESLVWYDIFLFYKNSCQQMWFIYKTKFASGLSPVTASQMSMEWVIHPSYKYKRSPQFKQWMMKSDCRDKKKRTHYPSVSLISERMFSLLRGIWRNDWQQRLWWNVSDI